MEHSPTLIINSFTDISARFSKFIRVHYSKGNCWQISPPSNTRCAAAFVVTTTNSTFPNLRPDPILGLLFTAEAITSALYVRPRAFNLLYSNFMRKVKIALLSLAKVIPTNLKRNYFFERNNSYQALKCCTRIIW
jgi:hypothetical protein